jgi:hypothetical protein
MIILTAATQNSLLGCLGWPLRLRSLWNRVGYGHCRARGSALNIGPDYNYANRRHCDRNRQDEEQNDVRLPPPAFSGMGVMRGSSACLG